MASSKKYTVTNLQVKLQDNVSNTLIATWRWGTSNTDHYEYKWQYLVSSKRNYIWVDGSNGNTNGNIKNSTYSIPTDAVKVRFTVKPVAKDKKVKKKDGKDSKGKQKYKYVTVPYWTANYSGWKTYDVRTLKPAVPSVPNTSLINNGTQLNTYVDIDMSGSSINRATKVEFELYNCTTSKTNSRVTIKVGSTGRVAYTFTLARGCKYRVRCRAIDAQKNYSGWTVYTPYPDSILAAPCPVTKGLKAKFDKMVNGTKVILVEWTKAINNVSKYEIEYTTEPGFFNRGQQYVKRVETSNGNQNKIDISIQEDQTLYGNKWFFRVRAVNDSGVSSWYPSNTSKCPSVIVGTQPEAPTTWSLDTTVEVGKSITLYWIHNTTDGSNEEKAFIHLTVDGVDISPDITVIKKDKDEPISSYSLKTSQYPDGAKIDWKVKTKGVYATNSPWSISRTIEVVAKPTLTFDLSQMSPNWYWDSLNFVSGSILNTEGSIREVLDGPLERFPFYIFASAGPRTQSVIKWYVTITTEEAYETFDYESGTTRLIGVGETVYSTEFYFDDGSQNPFDIFWTLFPSDIELETGIDYKISVKVVMNTGLSIEKSRIITTDFKEYGLDISASIYIDEDTASAYISPNLVDIEYEGIVVRDQTDNLLKFKENGTEDLVKFTSTEGLNEGDTVYVTYSSSITEGMEEELLATIATGQSLRSSDAYFSVYRINFDGTLTEIQSRLDGSLGATVIDYHPSLDYARYRIVAISKITGRIVYEDFIEEFGDGDIILQWNNKTVEHFVVNDENGGNDGTDIIDFPDISGEFLRLPWNIDTSESHSRDNVLVEYIGRKNPVAYYGTQLGETAVWNTDVDKEDVETIYALRRLAIYQGDVYVREPSGVGYWAQVDVSFSNTHDELIIPVTLSITRVEGGA